MPEFDESAGEIRIKLVYHGPDLSGRTSNLQYIYNHTRPEAKGSFEPVASETVRDFSGRMATITTILGCDIIPLTIAPIRGCRLRVRLFASRGPLYIEGIEERVLQGADGVVFVADSQRTRDEANIAKMEALTTYVARQGRTFASMPLVLQYNKRDHPDAMPVAELDSVLNPDRRPSFEAVAPNGQGVFDALKAVVKPIVAGLRALP